MSLGLFKRAEALIVAHCSEPLKLLDIANAMGVSARTLRDGFQQFRGVSPMQYVQRLRLERARKALRAASADARNAEIALDCGIRAFRAFPVVCKAMFRESPSETLR